MPCSFAKLLAFFCLPPVYLLAQQQTSIFHNPIPADQLAFLSRLSGATSDNALHDKQFRRILRSVLPECTYHYGWDMPPHQAFETVLKGSPAPVDIRNGRYVSVASHGGSYLGGRGFVWFDLQDGIGLAAFYFRPTNGEPTPSVTVFSRQVSESTIAFGQLPPAFPAALNEWSQAARVPPVTVRYFITGAKKKILLEHDEDYCKPSAGTAPVGGNDCLQMDAEAADIDLDAANYLDQTHHATNGTAWMINGADQVAWVVLRDNTCGSGPDPLGCRIRMTRERTRRIIRATPPIRPTTPLSGNAS